MTMIMIDKAVLEQALAEMERHQIFKRFVESIAALREALAQPTTLNGNDIFQDTEGTIPVTAVSQQVGFVAQQLILPSSDGIFLEVPQAQQPERQSVPAGWKLVPIEPSDEMIDATYAGQHCSDIWRDMIAAAPQPQQPLSEEEIQQLKLDCGYGYYSSYEVSATFINGVKECEAAHGITKENA